MSIRHNRDMRYQKSRNNKVVGPKTFKTEESAKAYAEKARIKKYSLLNVKTSEAKVKKIRVVAE